MNTGGITFFNGRQTTDENIGFLTVRDNKFSNCYRSIAFSSVNKTLDDVSDNLTIENNDFLNSVLEDIGPCGFKQVRVIGNRFRLNPRGSASYRGGVSVGSASTTAIDWIIRDNLFSGLRPQFGSIPIYSARKLTIEGNEFENITGRGITLISSDTAPSFRYLEDIKIAGNRAHKVSANGYSDSSPSAVTNLIVRGVFEKNVGTDKDFILGAPQVYPEGFSVAAPTTGTWQRGEKVLKTVPSAGNFAFSCSVSGTFGTLSGVTCDAVNGSSLVTNVSDLSSLREGQHISIDGATQRAIIEIDRGNNTMTLSASFPGTTGTSLPVAWFAPSFQSV